MTQIQLLTGFISLILLLNTHSCEKTLSTSIGLSNNVQIQIVYTYRRDRTDFVVNSRLNGDFINNGWISFGLKNDQNFVIILKFYFFSLGIFKIIFKRIISTLFCVIVMDLV
jgi:hypothetical protein